MPSCAAIKCVNRSDCRGQQLFRFPLGDPERLRRWVDNVRRKSWTPNEHSRLCAQHFEEECFIVSSRRKCLTSTAVPTIFTYFWEGKSLSAKEVSVSKVSVSHTHTITHTHVTDHSYAKHPTQNVAEVLDKDSVTVMQESFEGHVVSDVLHDSYTAKPLESVTDEAKPMQDTSVSLETTIPDTEHNSIVMESLKLLKRQFENQLDSMGEKLDKCRKKLKLEKRKNKRLKQKVDSLTEVISVLKKKSLIS